MTPPRRRREGAAPLLVALLASIGVHLLLVDRWPWPSPGPARSVPSASPLAVRLLPPASVPGRRPATPAPRGPAPGLEDTGAGPPSSPSTPMPPPHAGVEAPPAEGIGQEPPPSAGAAAALPAPDGPTPASTAEPATAIAPDALAVLPRSGRLGYAITTGSPPIPVGRAVYAWQAGEGRYRLELIARTTGLAGLLRPAEARQRSAGRLDEHGLRPERFTLDRGDGRPTETADFDWERMHIRYGRAGALQVSSLAPGTQDTLSLMLHLAFVPPGEDVRTLPLATGRTLRSQAYSAGATHPIETPAGSFRALHLRRVPLAGSEEGYDLWLAEDRPWLPVRIRWTERGGRVTDAVLDTIEDPAPRDPPPR